jgi:hypothetical protein
LPSFTLEGLDGKTFTLTDEISFSYPVSGVTFSWAFTPAATVSVSSLRGAPYSRSNLSTDSDDRLLRSARNDGMSSAPSATTSAPRFTPAGAGLTPGTYQLTVTVSQAGSPSRSATATINLVSANLNSVKVYPNPWRLDKHAAHPTITFAGLTVGTTIKIFTVSGHEAKELRTDGPSISWDLSNESGDKVASGIYLYLITDSQGDKVRGKVAVIK